MKKFFFILVFLFIHLFQNRSLVGRLDFDHHHVFAKWNDREHIPWIEYARFEHAKEFGKGVFCEDSGPNELATPENQVRTFDVVFNEIMVDPFPSVGLPEAEFIELFNRTGDTIDMTGWVILADEVKKKYTSWVHQTFSIPDPM